MNEDSTLLFAPSQSDTITLSDSFAGSTPLTLTLSVNDGTLALGSTNGLTSVSGNGSSTISITGTLANLNADLNGLIYTPTAGFHGQDTLSFTVTDTGTNLSDSITTNIIVNPFTPPAISVPGALSANENTPVVFSSANGTAISFTDSFAGSTLETLTLNVTDGSLALGSTSGLTSVSGNGSASITATGTLAQLNTAVSGLTYTPGSGFSGSDSLQISLTDSGDNLSGSASVGLTVTGAPRISIPSAVNVSKNTAFTFSGGNTVSVSDPAGSGNTEQLILHAGRGTVRFTSLSGLKVVSGANKSASLTVSGTLTNLDHDLAGLVYTPTSGYTGSDSITALVIDQTDGLTSPTATIAVTVGATPAITSAKTATFAVGNNGSFTVRTSGFPSPTVNVSGSLPSGVTFNPTNGVLGGMPNAGTGGTYHLTITASNGFGSMASESFTLTVYQQPTVNVPAGANLNESTPMVFSSGNGNAISVADPNAASSDRLTLTATHGTIKLGATAGLHVISGANKSASLTVSGTLANLNAALNGLTFTPAAGYVGNASLTVTLANPTTGLSNSSSLGLTVNAVSQSHQSSVGCNSGHGGEAGGYSSDWAGLVAALDELYT